MRVGGIAKRDFSFEFELQSGSNDMLRTVAEKTWRVQGEQDLEGQSPVEVLKVMVMDAQNVSSDRATTALEER